MDLSRPKGTNDILPGEVEKWQYVESVVREISARYGFREIRTPIFEHTQLFRRGIGETTDIVEKEMYTFLDKADRSITLRPEGTAAVVRAYLENKLNALPQPVKLFYIGPMFRYDKPQAGRFRQFHQFGYEVLGSREPIVDAEIILLAYDLYQRLGMMDLEVKINSVGCPKCRSNYREELQGYLRDCIGQLCALCCSRFERNPMRIFDCKNPKCQEQIKGAPSISKWVCNECADHFTEVKACLDALGVPYVEDPGLVRGLDYYTNTAFEIIFRDLGAQSAIGGGGRYDGLVEECGGSHTPAIGFATGMERILISMQKQGIEIPATYRTDVFFAFAGIEDKKKYLPLIHTLRKEGFAVQMDYLDKSLKAQMKSADKFSARLTLIIGDDEDKSGNVLVRDMGTKEQETVSAADVVGYCKAKLGMA